MKPTSYPDLQDLEVTLRFRPSWPNIESARELGRYFCERNFTDPDLTQRVQVVLHELVENAIKYSEPDTVGEIELSIRSSGGRLIVACTSRPDLEHLQKLRGELDHLRTDDPKAAFVSAFQRAAREPSASARIGLSRIRYEGGFELDLAALKDGRIHVAAATAL